MDKTFIGSGSAFEEQIGYSRAVVAGDTIFVSGTTGYDYEMMTIADDIESQTEQTLKNIEAALSKADASLKDVVRVHYIVHDANEFEKCWPILRKYFSENRPAATMFSAKLINERVKIEIEVTAVKTSG